MLINFAKDVSKVKMQKINEKTISIFLALLCISIFFNALFMVEANKYRKLYRNQFEITEDVKSNYRRLKEQYDNSFEFRN